MPSFPGQFQVLDVVALKTDLPEHNLTAGQVGTLVEPLAPNVYEVDFSDDDGQTYAMLPLHTSQLLKLHYSAANEFADNVIDLGSKVGIELQLPPAP
jgi:hypothetical protein